MLSSDQLKAAIDAVRKYKPSSQEILSNLTNTAPQSFSFGVTSYSEWQPSLTRAEIADYLARAGWNPDKARELAAVERSVDFGDGLPSTQLEIITDLIISAAEPERHTLQLDIIDLVARWLLRKRSAVAPDGGIVLGVRTLTKARRTVSGWIKDEMARRRSSRDAPPASNARSGRPQRLSADFVEFAAELWRNTKPPRRQRPGSRLRLDSVALSKVTLEELARIANSLDRKRYIPPADYLEKKFADELRRYNTRNSNSKTGAIKSWSQLVAVGDKDHLRGMRRLLSRCAEKARSSGDRMSGN